MVKTFQNNFLLLFETISILIKTDIRVMLKTVLFLISFACIVNSNSQNLLANGSLNERNTCTERNAQCAPEAWFFIPTYAAPSRSVDSNFFEVISMGGIARSTSNARNYIYSKILCRLMKDRQYKFSVWINTAKNKFDHLDIWLGKYEPTQKEIGNSIANPSFTISAENEDSSKIDWKKYSYVYTANGAEQFLMLGNLTDGKMDKSKVSQLSTHGWVLYAIDDLALTSLDSPGHLCREYNAVLKQVYNQNYRHPARPIEDIKLDTSVAKKDSLPVPQETIWEIIDTPPSLAKKVDTLTIPDVLFVTNSSKLNPAFIKDLNALVLKLKALTFQELEINGHTDDRGTSSYNLQLSKDRAEAIKKYLLARLDLTRQKVTARGVGELQPVADNKTVEGRQKNRRVEIVIRY